MAVSLRNIGRAKDWMPTARKHPLVVGRRYRILRPLPFFYPAEATSVDEIVIYQGSGYSWYDSASVFAFVTESGEPREWFLRDFDPIEKWEEFVLPVE